MCGRVFSNTEGTCVRLFLLFHLKENTSENKILFFFYFTFKLISFLMNHAQVLEINLDNQEGRYSITASLVYVYLQACDKLVIGAPS